MKKLIKKKKIKVKPYFNETVHMVYSLHCRECSKLYTFRVEYDSDNPPTSKDIKYHYTLLTRSNGFNKKFCKECQKKAKAQKKLQERKDICKHNKDTD